MLHSIYLILANLFTFDNELSKYGCDTSKSLISPVEMEQ